MLYQECPIVEKMETQKVLLAPTDLNRLYLSAPGANVEDRPFLVDIKLTFTLRRAITSFFKMSIPLKMFLKQNIRLVSFLIRIRL